MSRLHNEIKFQKILTLAAGAANEHEAEAAEAAARRFMAQHKIDPTDTPDFSLYSQANFANNASLQKLRAEWRETHPQPVNTKKRRRVKPVNTREFDGMFDDFDPESASVNTKPVNTKPVNTKDTRLGDRLAPSYMREYMRKRRAKERAKRRQ
jgi:hypothetical protein